MDIYIVTDDEGHIESVYDKEGIKKEYPNLISDSYYYINQDFWDRYTNVYKYKLNSNEGEDVDPGDIREPLGLDRNKKENNERR
jgi:hypothetical protein